MKKDKIVFVLGAGFSKPAEAPLQSEIIDCIFDLKEKNLGGYTDKIQLYLNEFEKFLEDVLFFAKSDFRNVALEDIFTPLDRCILDGISFRTYDCKQLVDLREKIYSLIIYAIKVKLENSATQKDYINLFGHYLVNKMKPRCKDVKLDPVSIISTNWDILLDNSIKKAISSSEEYGVVDYCCYISSLDNDETIKPGLWALGKGGYNVKLLKLHGSMNWLHCPKCQRLFVAFDEKIAAYGILKSHSCKYCDDGLKNSFAILRSNLIMPTFLKDFNDFQIKLIWQNASVELAEATKVVFIGYSLPQADYELRQLLSRSIPHNAEIEVVMLDETISKVYKDSNELTLSRYKFFFGKRKVTPKPLGVEKYIEQLVNS